MELMGLLRDIPTDKKIMESYVLTYSKILRYDNIMCSISGGSDSDILLDICHRIDQNKKIKYVFFDTGLEYSATKQHLDELEKKYGITIDRIRGNKTIPECCKSFGQPFISKQVSEWISRLQRHSFQWEDAPLEYLEKKYPNCRAALRWWCNDFERKTNNTESSYNIAYNKYLKEFMIKNPPTFSISNKCCYYAKKVVATNYKKLGKFDLSIIGVRKAEGGARSTAYKSCFSSGQGCDEYRPIFWYKKETKQNYEKHFQIQNSQCYELYGLKRTGCAGCPYGKNLDDELEVLKKYEPQLFKGVNVIFKDTYAYTLAYKNFIKENKGKEMNNNGSE